MGCRKAPGLSFARPVDVGTRPRWARALSLRRPLCLREPRPHDTRPRHPVRACAAAAAAQ
eukprot:3159739-Prymnesium_polylepis.1